MTGPEPLLTAEQVSISFGALKAVAEMELRVSAGEIVGLIGPNGAGKSTLVNGISGLVPLQKGRITLDGQDITRLAAYRRFRVGLGRTFQHVTLADELTVRSSLKVAEARGRYLRPPHRDLDENTLELCRQVGLDSALDKRVDTLSFMYRRLLSIVTALCGGTRVALLDEATAGLSRNERAEIGSMLVALIRDHPDRALLVIEHDLEFVRSVTTRSVAMVTGRLVAEGPTADVLKNPTLVTAYIGE